MPHPATGTGTPPGLGSPFNARCPLKPLNQQSPTLLIFCRCSNRHLLSSLTGSPSPQTKTLADLGGKTHEGPKLSPAQRAIPDLLNSLGVKINRVTPHPPAAPAATHISAGSQSAEPPKSLTLWGEAMAAPSPAELTNLKATTTEAAGDTGPTGHHREHGQSLPSLNRHKFSPTEAQDLQTQRSGLRKTQKNPKHPSNCPGFCSISGARQADTSRHESPGAKRDTGTSSSATAPPALRPLPRAQFPPQPTSGSAGTLQPGPFRGKTKSKAQGRRISGAAEIPALFWGRRAYFMGRCQLLTFNADTVICPSARRKACKQHKPN